MTRQTGLVPRNFDATGRLQMAEGRLSSHTPAGTAVEDLFLVHHYAQPHGNRAQTLRLRDGAGTVHEIDHDLLRSLPARTVRAVLECAGNGRGLLARRAPGNQFGLGLFGQGEWTGASLRDVLRACEVSETDWDTMVVTAPDEGTTQPENTHAGFAKGLSRAKALHPDTIIAWLLDGEPVSAAHGGPIRLVVPGWYGIWWVKWPQEIELSRDQFTGFWQNERYTYQDDDGTVLSVVREQLPRAVVVSPEDGARVYGDAPLEILAWAGESEVALVEVTVNDGESWFSACQSSSSGRWAWTQWTVELPAGLPRGLRRIAVRATDSNGRLQDWQPKPNRLGYGNNGIHQIEVDLIARQPDAYPEGGECDD